MYASTHGLVAKFSYLRYDSSVHRNTACPISLLWRPLRLFLRRYLAMQLQVVNELGRIHRCDCITLMKGLESESIDLVFAAPPFNIGYDYDEYHDKHADETYVDWCVEWMSQV